MSQTFKKTKENFACKHCGFKVMGTGYTNHCPNCLFSLHADISPGDRKEKCKGLMEPVNLELKNGRYILTHKCQKCGAEKHCKTSPQDDINALTKLSESLVKKTFF